MKYILGIDLGTSAVKTVLFNSLGVVITSASKEYPLYQPHNGWAEQDPNDWYQAAIETIKLVVNQANVAKEGIVSIGISGQMHGLVMLDQFDQVIRKSIIWADQRTEKECEELTKKIGTKELIEITANPALTGFTASKILWVKNNEPNNFDKCYKILLPKDYLRYKLTGVFATDYSDASGMQILDLKKRKWSDKIMKALSINETMLPKLYDSYQVTGFLTDEMAKLMGLSTNTSVVGGAGDNAAAAIGTTIINDKEGFLTLGTSGVLYIHTKEMMIDRLGRYHTFCSAIPNEYHVMGVTQGAGLSLQWIKNNFYNEEAKHSNNIYNYMFETTKEIPIGADKLLFLPYLMGERTPHLDPNARGVFFGLSAVHTKAHLTRAVIEGISYSMLDCLNLFRETHLNISNLMIAGGGGKNAVWRQMLADILAVNIRTVQNEEGPALGVAILAAVGSQIYPDIKTAVKQMVKINQAYQQPELFNNVQYLQYYQVYQRLYQSLKKNFKELSKL